MFKNSDGHAAPVIVRCALMEHFAVRHGMVIIVGHELAD
jgi:hypothetical protein